MKSFRQITLHLTLAYLEFSIHTAPRQYHTSLTSTCPITLFSFVVSTSSSISNTSFNMSSYSSTSSISTRSEDIGVLYEDPVSESSSAIDIPAGPSRRDSLASLFNFSWDTPGNDEHVDFHVDDTIARSTRIEMRAEDPTLRIDSEGLPLGRRGTPPVLPISDFALALNQERIAQANWEIRDEWIMEQARNWAYRPETPVPSPPLSFTTASDLSTATTLATSSDFSRVTTLVNSPPMRPESPPVPTTQGRVEWPEYSPASSVPPSPVWIPAEDPFDSPPWNQFSWLVTERLVSVLDRSIPEDQLDYRQGQLRRALRAQAPSPPPAPAPRASGPTSIPIVAEPERPARPTDQTLSPQLLSRHSVMYGRIMDRIR
ncbi:hypothetical protein EDD37DRAFT_508004 [Exophiala viscosa]|uniref:uncharacterized protein n=1 Tax=Exophiala viscosa TaxID=2486360 RepID=UPI002190CDEE|nr:hypothetical protein EDD37DRAFT_508004 [Exophiala viscosa]